MSTELLQAVADTNEWWAIGPEMTLAIGALGLLVLEILLPKKDLRYIPPFAIMTLVVVLISVGLGFNIAGWDGELFGGLLPLSGTRRVARGVFPPSSRLVLFSAPPFSP